MTRSYQFDPRQYVVLKPGETEPRARRAANRPIDSPAALGARLKQLRQRRDVAAGDLARKLDAHVTSIYNVERGTHSPTVARLLKWCDALGAELLIRKR